MIYWVRAGNTDAVKVGYATRDVAARLRLLQTGCPWPLLTLRVEVGDRLVEAALHRFYSERHIRAEWFSLSDEDVAVNLDTVQVSRRSLPVKNAFPLAEDSDLSQFLPLSAVEIEALARKAGLSLTQLCLNAGIAISTFWRWRSGVTDLNLGAYKRVLAAVRSI